MNINKVMLSGNLTRDAEIRATKSGATVVNFGIASNESVKNATTGEWEQRPNFIDCSMFGNYAHSVASSGALVKGLKVALTGKLRWSQWERDGQKRCKIEVIVDTIDLLRRPSTSEAIASSSEPKIEEPLALYDEDIPF